MSRYPDDVRSQALAMLQAEGYDTTIRSLGIARDTLYRWKREAGLIMPHRRSVKDNLEMLPQLDESTRDIASEPSPECEEEVQEVGLTADATVTEETPEDDLVTDMMLLAAANEQLRARNAQLRKALVALLEH